MRRGIAAIGAFALSATLAACGPAGGSQSGSAAGAPSGADTAASSADGAASGQSGAAGTTGELGTLTVWADDTRYGQMVELSEEFTAKTQIGLNVVKKSEADMHEEFATQVPTGNGPDIIILAHDRLGALVENGVVAPVDLGNAKSALSPSAVQGVTYKGQTYGMPYAIESLALVRNNKVTKDEPKTFDEMITSGKNAGAERPFVVQAGMNNQLDPYHLYPFQTSFGAPVFKQEADGSYTTELAMGGEEGKAFAEWVKTQADAKTLDLSLDADIAKQTFLDGKAAYTLTGPWNISAFREAKMDISVLPIPSAGGKDAQPFVGVQAFFASAKSEQPLLIADFMEYMGTPEAQQKLYELGGRVPAITSVADKVEDADVKAVAAVATKGVPMPSLPQMNAVWEFWGATMGDIAAGKQAPDQGWTTMITNIQQKISK